VEAVVDCSLDYLQLHNFQTPCIYFWQAGVMRSGGEFDGRLIHIAFAL
jgi:hypothetical protein